jgi:hypothetical protein
LTDEGLEVDCRLWSWAVGPHLNGPPHEALFTVLECD